MLLSRRFLNSSILSSPEFPSLVFGTPDCSLHSSVRHCVGSTKGRAGATEDITGRATKLNVDDTVENEVDGEIHQEQTVGRSIDPLIDLLID